MKWLKRLAIICVSIYAGLIGIIYFVQEGLVFTPTVVTPIHNYGFKGDVDDLWLDREDGAKLHVVRFNNGGDRGKLLYFHGNGGNNGYSERMAETFTNLGYEVYGIDYRGYGKSRGDRSEAAMLEDAEYFYDKVSRYGKDEIVIVGWSLGTVFASHVASERETKELILFAPMSSAIDIGKRRYPFIPEFISDYPFRTDQKFSKIKAPVTIYHGKQDMIVPHASGIMLKEYFKEDDRFISVEGATHNSIPFDAQVIEDITLILGS